MRYFALTILDRHKKRLCKAADLLFSLFGAGKNCNENILFNLYVTTTYEILKK